MENNVEVPVKEKETEQTPKEYKYALTKLDPNLSVTEQIEKLFKSDRKKFLGFIRQRVRSQEEAEDILQDVFTNVLAAANNVQKPIENIASWVFTAVRNRIIDSYRKKRAETFSNMQTPGQSDDGIDSFENFLGDLSNTPEINLMRKTIWDAVQSGLEELPLEQREVFVKNEFEGVSFREMSRRTGININTLLARKRYAVLHLRRRLKDLYSSTIKN
ncbi:MAG: RNA polymerase sigma factor [Candidatus Kapabacteria bacterium]|nr:RNA polymerase sigma factor [Candidatus Kapabacteria bacterium]